MTNLDNILKGRDITDKGPSGHTCGFPVVMYVCESWTIKKVEHLRTDAFELWHWRRLLDCKEINYPILKEINPEHSLEGLMLKLKL